MKKNGKTNGKPEVEIARVSPSSTQEPPASLIEFIPAQVAFTDVNVMLAAATLKALGVEPTEALDRRFYNLDPDELSSWNAREIEPCDSALIYVHGSRYVTAVMLAPQTIDTQHGHRQWTPFANFFRVQRGERPHDPAVPMERWIENEERARLMMLFDGVAEEEALGESGQIRIERFHTISAETITPRVVMATGPHSSTTYLLASYPVDRWVFSVGLLSRTPLRRAYEDPQTWAGDVTAWNHRTIKQL